MPPVPTSYTSGGVFLEDGLQHAEDPPGLIGRAEEPRSTEERLTAALEALAARDGLLAERARRLVALEDAAARLSAATARLEAAASDLAALRLARRGELAERDRRIAQLEHGLIEARRAAEALGNAPDDLKRIKGIGPVIEALLHSIGIDAFQQVAALSQGELQRVGDLLGSFRGRIQRDRWVEQAAELAGGERRTSIA